MWKLAVTGLALLIAGAVKFTLHVQRAPTLEDYLAFRCGPGSAGAGADAASHALLSGLHCWGCPAMLIGAGLIAVSALQAARAASLPTRAATPS